jgi:cell division ATPase FtsA
MYATAVGLVMKGIEKYERESKRGINTTKIKEEPIVESKEVKKKEEKKVTEHSSKKVGSFLSDILNKTRDWISDDVE